MYFSGAGVEAERGAGHQAVDRAGSATRCGTRLNAADRRGKPDADARREIAEIQRKIARYKAARVCDSRPTRRSAKRVTLQVTLAADAEPGQREMRVETPAGDVESAPVLRGPAPRIPRAGAGRCPGPARRPGPDPLPGHVTTDITLPAVVNGQIIPREPDVVDSRPEHVHARRRRPLPLPRPARASSWSSPQRRGS